MKGKKHTPEQIIKKLREADAMLASGKTLGQVCQALEVSEQTFHRWRNQYFELTEATTKNRRGRLYRLWIAANKAKHLSPLSSESRLGLTVKMGGNIALQMHCFVDQVLPFELDGETVVEISGVDTFTGCRNLIGAKFNFQVDPTTSMMMFAAWIDPEILTPDKSIKQVTIPGIERFLQIPGHGSTDFRNFLKSARKSNRNDNFQRLCDYFDEILTNRPRQMTPLTAPAFLNLATLVQNNLRVFFAAGSLRGSKATGITKIGPGIIIAGPDELPFGLIGESSDKPLCENWDHESARLVTFFLANEAADTPEAGWRALKHSFDYLNVAGADAGWLHSKSGGMEVRLCVDSRVQDAILELDHWYHVHDLYTGVAHQYYSSKDKDTNTLSFDDASLQAIGPRLSILMKTHGEYRTKLPRLVSHLLNAVFWISRAKASTTLGEQFLCIWIAGEFLALYGDSNASDGAIKSTVSSRIGALMGKGERVARKFWQSTMEECYDLRCSIVHEAEEHEQKLAKLTPLLLQAVVEVVMHCTLSLPELITDTTPAELLDQSRKGQNARALN